MKILVQKFGGTSVATAESREKVYSKILKAKEQGYGVVVVISAMGRKGAPYATDTLLDLIRLDCPNARKREQDQIFICGEIIAGTLVTANLQQRGHMAAYLTGQQAGIITNDNHADARILKIDTSKIMGLLEEGYIVVVAGGQGATEDGEITTLGRGGSDTTGCALGVALGAERIEIYTDVEGVMTTDPRIVPEARLFEEITYDNCIEMAYQGAKVMHPRAVEIASQKPHIELYVRSVFSDNPGTLICSNRRRLADGADLPGSGGPVGVAIADKQAIYRVRELPPRNKTTIIQTLVKMKVIAIDICPHINEVMLVAEERDVDNIEKLMEGLNVKGECLRSLSKISVVGDNLASSPELLASLIESLENSGVNVIAVSTQNKSISIWVSNEYAKEAIKAVHCLV